MTSAVLLSGGMDSTAIAYWKRPEHAITIDYGQLPAPAEIRAAAAVATNLGIAHHVLRVDLKALGSGDMAGTPALAIAPVREWWPYRNQMLITLAAMKAIQVGADRLLIGTLVTDGAHADGRPEFVAMMDQILQIQEGILTLEAPAIELTAIELVRTSGVPRNVLAWAHSCHRDEYACGICGGCRKHYETWAALGVAPY